MFLWIVGQEGQLWPEHTAARMRMLSWVHRNFRQNHDYNVKDFSPGCWAGIVQGIMPPSKTPYLDERATNVKVFDNSEVKGDTKCGAVVDAKNEDTEALLGGRGAVGVLFSNWQEGLLAIGTLGFENFEEHNHYHDASSKATNLGLEESAEAEAVNPMEVKALEEELEKVFGSVQKNVEDAKAKGQHDQERCRPSKESSADRSNNNGSKAVFPLQEFFLASPLLSNKKEHRTTLADLFSRSKNRASNIFDDGKAEDQSALENAQDKQKGAEKIVQSGHCFLKKFCKWKKGVHHGGGGSKTKLDKLMMRMFHKKIHPDGSANLPVSELERCHVSKTFVNASKLIKDQLDDDNSTEVLKANRLENDISDGPKRYSLNEDVRSSNSTGDMELVSLLRDNSRGSQECWIKTDSEYVVLEL